MGLDLNCMKDKVREATNRFVEHDPDLLGLNAHEQAMSHRIGLYLEELFSSEERLKVDCEYNKHLDGPKKINLNDLDLGACRSCDCHACKKIVEGSVDEILEKNFRPDIVLHSRGNDTRNLIAIEIKKGNVCPFDEAKLRALTTPKNKGGEYAYELGVFIWFPESKPKYKWFIAGVEA